MNRENDFLSPIYETCEKVERAWVKFRSGMETAGRCRHVQFTEETFNKNNILKTTLSSYVFNCNNAVNSHIDIVDQFKKAVDRLVQENAKLKEDKMQLLEEVSWLKSSAIKAQDSIIGLQSELLDCKDDQLKSVQSTVSDAVKTSVKSEMKSYSDAVSSAPKPRGPDVKSVKCAVKEVVQAEDRSRNLIVFGMKEEASEDTGEKICEMLEYLGEKPRQESVRIGVLKSDSNTPRPVKVSLATSAHVVQILRAAKKLKNSEKFGSVFICPDRSPEERKMRHEAVMDLKRRLNDEPNKRHFIRGLKVVTVSEG